MILTPLKPRINVARRKATYEGISLNEGILLAQEFTAQQQFLDALDLYEHLYRQYPQEAVQILARAYDSIYRILREKKNRYWMYQARYFDFQIGPQDKVLDIGSGHMPFPFATHLADFAIEDNAYGRAGEPFRMVEGKKIFQCNIEKMPFENKEFDFVYCSHVLEHTENPEQACRELMRIAKRGYIETPTKGKDIFFDSARVSNHRWSIDLFNRRLVFTEYHPEEQRGLECNVLGRMVADPKTEYEKAFYALHFLRADMLNVMLYWEDQFEYEVRRFSNLPEEPAVSNAAVSMSDGCFRGEAPQEPRFSFVMIVLNGMPFLEYSLKSIYEFAHEIIIVEGAVEKCLFAANPDGSSKDGTVEFLRTFPDPAHKIRLIQGRWPEKCEMQNEALRYVTGDYVWLIDSDEVYKREDLEKIRTLLKNDPSITQVNFIPDNFWKGLDYIFVSPRFFEPAHHYRRLFQFRPGAVFTSHRPPTLRWPGCSQTTEQMKLLDGQTTRRLGIIPFHYSYVTEEQVRQKIELYRRYGWGRMWNLDLQEWYEQCFLKWTPENREEIEKKWPVWTGDRNSHTERFTGTHPEVMRDFMEKVKTASAADAVFPEEKTLPILGSPAVAARVLQNWQLIETDEPIRNRIAMIQKHLSEGKPFWNLYVALAYTAARLKPKSYLEIGVRTGASMVQVLGQSELDLAVGVDLWTGSYSGLPNTREYTEKQLQTFLLKTGRRTKIRLIQGDSHQVLKQLIQEGRRFELITVDGDHSQAGAWEDLLDAKKLLADRGVIVFDDLIHPQFSYLLETAKRFVREFPEFRLLLNTKQDNGTAVFLKGILPEEFLRQAELTPAKTSSLKVAEEYVKNGMAVEDGSAFAEAIARVFQERRPRKIIETGTYLGRGTTTILAEAMRRSGIEGTFFTIEVNPNYYAQAKAYLESRGYPVKPLCGLSIPRRLLPARDQIQTSISQTAGGESIFVDHPEPVRAERYYQETDFPDVPDDLLGRCLEAFDGRPDFVLLDSAGHLGWIEFQYLLERLKGPCIIALDDIYHVKHYRSFQQMQNDKRFEILTASKEKFGFCIARFEPQSKPQMTAEPLPEPKHILWLRPDAIGDGVLSASMLPGIRRRFPKTRLTVLVEESTAPLYEACPYVDEILRFKTEETYKPSEFLQSWVPRILNLKADWLLHSVYSRQYLMDGLVYLSKIPVRIGMEGDCTNILPEQKAESDRWYTYLIPSPGVWKSELERHRDFLKGLGCESESLKPMIWLTKEDEAFARRWFEEHSVAPERAVILFARARVHFRLYEGYGRALEKTALRRRMTVIALGCKSDYEINQRNLEPLSRSGVQTFNLSGGLTLRQSAALIKYARLAVGAETGLAHIAAALEVPHVIVIGGGHFGRFMPYSPKTTLAALPLDCYRCNWNCRYSQQKTYCIQDLQPFVLSEAVERTLESSADKPRIFIPDSASYQKADEGPSWKLFGDCLNGQDVETVSVSAEKTLPKTTEGSERIQAAKSISHVQAAFPKITVVTPSFNQAKYLEACIQSILNQGYPNLEYIIMDGGSTDGSVEIIKKYEKYLTYWQSKPDGGQYAAVEEGFRRSTGEILTWLNSDDIFLPDALFKAAAIFQNRPDVSWLTAKTCTLREDGSIFYANPCMKLWNRDRYLRKDYKYIQQEGTFWRRSLWEKAGACLKKESYLAGDLELWMRFFRYADLFTAETYLGAFRYHSGQKTADFIEQYNQEAEAILEAERQEYEKQPPQLRPPLRPVPPPISELEISRYLKTLPRVKPKKTVQVSSSNEIRVSAIVSTYNSEAYIAGCLENLIGQTLYEKGQLEILVIDSGSQQNEGQIVREYQAEYPNIRYLRTPQRETIYAAWNRAVRLAAGRYLTSANTDDRYRSDALEILADTLDAHSEVGLVYGDQIISPIPQETFTLDWGEKIPRPDYTYERLLFGCCVGSQPMWRKSLHEELGYFDESLTVAGDWDFWLRIAARYPFKRVPEFLGIYYNNPNSAEHRNMIHSYYERYLVGKRYGNPYISTISRCIRKDNPLVSVILPAHNARDFIGEAIESVLIQNYPHFELLVINDGSEDDTEAVVKRYEDERIRYFVQERGGPSAARNEGIRRSKGEFFVMLDADDCLSTDHLGMMLSAFDEHPEADLIYCKTILINEEGKTVRVHQHREYSDPNQLIREFFHAGFLLLPFRTMIRRRVFEQIGEYDPSLWVAEDFDMWRRFLKQGLVFRYWPKSFYGRRIRENAWSKNVTPEKAAMHFSVLRRYLDTFAPEQLFPEVRWESYQGWKKEYMFRSLAAGVFVSLAEQYKRNGLSTYLIQSAAELAMEQIRICRSLCSDQPVPLSLEQRCRTLLIDAGAGGLQESAAGCLEMEVESCK